MPALSATVTLEFCKLCNWAYEAWVNHREFFDKNPRAIELQNSWAGEALARLSIISQEHALLQIIKLHDRAVMNGNVTLGIEYIISYGGWSESVQNNLEELAVKLNRFASQLRAVRNKVLSHTKLLTILVHLIIFRYNA